MSKFTNPLCWKADDARAVLVTEALSGDDAVFLATHTPVKGFEIAGTHASDVHEATERGLLNALSDPTRRHAFCALQGEPGSGKSHLIRWLAVNWPHDTDVCVLIQRADGSLDGALRQLKAKLPTDFAHLFEGLDRRLQATLAGRASSFLLTLGAALEPDHFEKPLEDTDWCRANDPAALVLNHHVRTHWRGPRRILELMDGKGQQRNSESASFTLQDIAELIAECEKVRDSEKSATLARRLLMEGSLLEEAKEAGWSYDDIRRDAADKFPYSLALMDALNRRRNHAVQNVIGVTAEGLKKVFEDLRAELQTRGQRLVLLLEDITSWQGLDDSLIDALVTDAQTRPTGDLCPLISVVGVTPEYYKELAGNYRQRITHDIRLGVQQGQLQDVAALRDPEDRVRFVGRYLSASRAGASALSGWRERLRGDPYVKPPNRCGDCPLQTECHRTFGDVDGVGLFPFTAEAVNQMFSALKDDDAGMTHRTPRGLLQAVLSPTLLYPDVIERGAYPGPQIETQALDRNVLPGALRQRIEARVSDEVDRERLRRLFAYWGDRNPVVASSDDGGVAFAGVKRELFEALDLPWIADDMPIEARPAVRPPSAPESPSPAEPEPIVSPITPAPIPGAVPERARSPRVTTTTFTPRAKVRTGPNRSELERLRADLEALREEKPLANASLWNRAVYDLVSKIDARRLGVDSWTWSKVFTPDTIKIAGTGQMRAYHFVVGRSSWLIEGLEGYIALRSPDALTEEEAEYYRRRVAFTLRQLERAATAHLRSRLPLDGDGESWDIAATVTQLLLARAWLRGTTSADRPTSEQWTALLSDEVDPRSDPGSRTQSWKDALSATNPRHDQLRRILREDIAPLRVGDSTAFGLADVSSAAAAIVALRDRFELTSLPSEDASGPSDDHDSLRQAAIRVADLLKGIPSRERKVLGERAGQLFDRLRGRSVPEHLRRVDELVALVSTALPTAAPQEVREWKQALERLRPAMQDSTEVSRLQNSLLDLEPDAGPPSKGDANLLCWLASLPAGLIEASLDTTAFGERVVERVLPHVKDLVGDAERAVSLASIHEVGAQLKQVVADARGRFEATGAEVKP